MGQNSSIRERIDRAVNNVDENEAITVSLKDLMFIFKTLEEFNSFFHQPLNYESVEDVRKFLGDVDEGGYRVLHHAYYHVFDRLLPEKIKQEIVDGKYE